MFKSKLVFILFPVILCGFIFGLSSIVKADCPTGCPQFNNCSGDLELLVLKNRTQSTPSWQDPVSANPGDRVAFQIYYHNCVEASTANNTKIRIDFTNVVSAPIVTTAYLWADNASYVSDNGTINLTTPQKLNFDTTAKWYPDQSSSPTTISVTKNVTSVEMNIGNIQGGWAHQGYVVIEAVLEPVTITNHPPTANAGPDLEVQSGSSITLQGSGSDPDGDTLTYSWSCNAGTLSNYYTAQPLYTGPSVSYNTYYTCTLTVNDGHSGTASDTMTVLVRAQAQKTLSVSLTPSPSSGNAPLNNVTLTANLSGTAQGAATYKLDCNNDGSWDRINTIDANSYAAYSLCNYSTAGTYTARAEVYRDGITAYNTATIYVSTSYQPITGNFTVTKLVKNLSDGTGWQSSVAADPGEVLYFLIQVTAGSNYLQNMYVKDTLPTKINYAGDLKVNDVTSAGDILNGLNIGDIGIGATRTVSFRAIVASAGQFNFGNTSLINTVQAYNTSNSVTGSATVTVTRSQVAGAVTEINTGINALYISLIIAFVLALIFYFSWIRLENSQNQTVRKMLSNYYKIRMLFFK